MNVIASPIFADRFSRSIDATFRSVFPFVTRRVLTETEGRGIASVLYLASPSGNGSHDIYTDDRNRSFLDD